MSDGPVASRIKRKLIAAFDPTEIELVDDSHRHKGHGGYNPDGESHFNLRIVSASFAGKSRVEMHRMVNEALAEELAGRVHALAISAKAP